MHVYRDWIFPRLQDCAMRAPEAAKYRGRIVTRAQGKVLEVGIGSGLNLQWYAPAVDCVCGLDPSAALLQMAARRAKKAGIALELLDGSAEQIPLEAQSVDTVVMTWTLCSIADPMQALSEMRRVLKLDGQLLFVEHGLAPDAKVRAWQHRLNPMWNRISGGCNLDRKIDELIRAAGLRLAELDTGYARGPSFGRPWSFMYCGCARCD
jgi:ubiquinone/menaquinone biosynthesis C-methylase UbiE